MNSGNKQFTKLSSIVVEFYTKIISNLKRKLVSCELGFETHGRLATSGSTTMSRSPSWGWAPGVLL
jgi:hypothetical protein